MPSVDINHSLGANNGLYLPKLSVSPGTPPTNKAYLYAKTDNILYVKNDAGAETAINTTDDFTMVLDSDATTTTTVSFDPLFHIALAASTTYVITARLIFRCNDATAGYAPGFAFGTLPSGTAVAQFIVPTSTAAIRIFYQNTANDNTNQNTRTMTANTDFLAEAYIVVNTGVTATSGTGWVALGFNSGNAAATATVKKGSMIHVIQI